MPPYKSVAENAGFNFDQNPQTRQTIKLPKLSGFTETIYSLTEWESNAADRRKNFGYNDERRVKLMTLWENKVF
jgi:hypothetical protein